MTCKTIFSHNISERANATDAILKSCETDHGKDIFLHSYNSKKRAVKTMNKNCVKAAKS